MNISFQPLREFFSPLALVIFSVSILCYLPGFWWGAPQATAPNLTHSWGVDDESPLGPLAEVHNIYQPKPDRNLGYPLMFSLILAGAYTPYILYLLVTQQLSHISGVFPFGLEDPVGSLKVLTYIAHFVTVMMGAGIVWAAFHIGRMTWNVPTGTYAALFTLLIFPMFYYSRNANVDVPMLFFAALALMVYTHGYLSAFSKSHVLWLGIFTGCSLATKESAMGLFLVVPLVLWWRGRFSQQDENQEAPFPFWKQSLWGTIGFVGAFGFGSGLFIEPSRFFAHLAFTLGKINKAAQGLTAVSSTFPFTMEGHFSFLHAMGQYPSDMVTGPGLVMGILGIGFIAACEREKIFVLLPGLSYVLFMFMAARSAQMRYLLPAAFVFSFCMARGVTFIWEKGPTFSKLLLLGVVSFISLLGIFRGIELTYEMIFDSRFTAGQWLSQVTTPGDEIEYFGTPEKLPPLMKGVRVHVTVEHPGIHFAPRVGAKAIASITEGWRERRPKFILIIPDLTTKGESVHNHSLPPEVYDQLLSGKIGYRLAKTIQTPKLFPWLFTPKLDYPTVNPPIRIFVRDDIFVSRPLVSPHRSVDLVRRVYS